MASPPVDRREERFNLNTIYIELKSVKYKWSEIGLCLGVPYYKIKEFEEEKNPLAAVIDYGLKGNIKNDHFSWESIVEALTASEESSLARRLKRKYCTSRNDAGSSYQESVLTITTSSSGSELPSINMRQYLPYLGKDDAQSTDELSLLCVKLDEQTSKLKRTFASLVFDLRRSIEATNAYEDLKTIVEILDDKKFVKVLSDCSNIAEMFKKLIPLVSFFDFDIIKLISKELGSEENKKKMMKYENMFKEYSKQRVCVCPSDAFGCKEKSDKVFIIKTDRHIKSLTVNEVHQLKYNLTKSLKIELRLLEIHHGCVKLTFRVCDNIAIAAVAIDEDELNSLGVISINYGKSQLFGAKVHDDGDSGFHSKESNTITTLHAALEDLSDPRIDMITEAESKPRPMQSSTPLFTAIIRGNLEQVKNLIDQGYNYMEDDKYGETCLHYAARCGQIEILKYLIEETECPPGGKGFCDMTILHIAASKKQFSVVKYLIENDKCKLDPTVVDEDNNSALYYACCSGDLDMVCYLIESMKTDFYFTLDEIFSHDGLTPSSKLQPHTVLFHDDLTRDPLSCSCYYGHLTIVKYLIKKYNCDPFKLLGEKKISPFFSAVLGNHIEVVKYLSSLETFNIPFREPSFMHVAASAINVDIKMVKYLVQELNFDFNSKFGNNTPLHLAARSGKLDIVKFFVGTLKCDPSIKGDEGNRPIHHAAFKGHLEVVQYLMKHAAVSELVNDLGGTPLHLASMGGNLPVVKYLVQKHKFNPSAIYNDRLGSSIHCAAGMQHLHIVRYFVKELKFDPNIKNKHSLTPLHCSVQNGALQFVQSLIEELGCDPHIADINQYNALHHAAIGGQLSVCEYLMKNHKCNFLSPDKKSLTPLHCAASWGQLDVVKYFMDVSGDGKAMYFSVLYNNTPLYCATERGHFEVVKYLIEEKACDPYIVDMRGDNLLHLAAAFGHLEIVEYLVHNTTLNPLTRDDLHDTALSLAAMKGHLSTLKFLFGHLKPKYDPSTLCNDDKLIHVATEEGHLPIVKYLVEEVKGDPSIQNDDGDMPIHRAAIRNELNILKYFVEDLKCDPMVTGRKNFAYTPLHFAVLNERLDIVKYLIEEQNCDAASKRIVDITLLHEAAMQGSLDIVRYLVSEKGVDPFCYSVLLQGAPIHVAALRDNIDVVKFFVKECDQLFFVNSNNQTPLQVALQNKRGLSDTALFLIAATFNKL